MSDVITDTETLRAFCDSLVDESYVTVDTEFIRESTFWPELCLVQVGGTEQARAIDTLAPGIDLKPLYDLMANTKVLKVFHAARQDLEIFLHLAGALPRPIFDTQVAAMVCGFGDSVGYENLITRLTNGKIDKGSRFTDWKLRPLSEKQIQYALADVTHLRPAYEILAGKLELSGRQSWVKAEMEILEDPKTYIVDPDDAYLRIKTRGAKGRQLSVLQAVAGWREREAQARNIPRNRVLRDEALLEISHRMPKTVDDLAKTRGLGRRLAEGSSGDALLKAIRKGADAPKSEWPTPPVKPDLPPWTAAAADLLKVLLKMKCADADVATKLVANAADVELIAAFGEDADVPAIKGWRRSVFGEDALRLRRGEICLKLDGERVAIVEKDVVSEAPD
ncbi:ribonuclease D [Thalassospiraceae bacterium LMO-JJ14]|nr:ribonuclease D [Thalassospiraceae bacterium LMO-JJ14]